MASATQKAALYTVVLHINGQDILFRKTADEVKPWLSHVAGLTLGGAHVKPMAVKVVRAFRFMGSYAASPLDVTNRVHEFFVAELAEAVQHKAAELAARQEDIVGSM